MILLAKESIYEPNFFYKCMRLARRKVNATTPHIVFQHIVSLLGSVGS